MPSMMVQHPQQGSAHTNGLARINQAGQLDERNGQQQQANEGMTTSFNKFEYRFIMGRQQRNFKPIPARGPHNRIEYSRGANRGQK